MPPQVASPDPVLRHYGRLTILLHWACTILVVGLWLQPWLHPVTGVQGRERLAHVALGAVLGLLLLLRITGRGLALLRRRALRSDLPAEAMHLALYALLFVTLAFGAIALWHAGISLAGLLAEGAYPAVDRGRWHMLVGLHGLAADLVLVFTGIHVTAALAHHFIWRDGLLARMALAFRHPPYRARGSRHDPGPQGAGDHGGHEFTRGQ
ncbi:Ni_hydr_CYTB domain-containing protein [Rhodovastum atsumiense]|uniref:Cytochrome b561 bacterial/Ni-hydrogenase domain-containing protein n=1 Tax=Rhodovastum atsumiense TaxID=504468 RepID=A0A5M6IWQ1_9PROT|nr:cytochrome b/b6 domain-containing protein [Rhodovastum atsumiense]KAA5612756.1 hypothetical protein F1189_08455 [Rhodovastum atsumiense]CAH2602681.1 Ni_hydr_CYTB domain-containing protein [Rhodovastum atsumiense]